MRVRTLVDACDVRVLDFRKCNHVVSEADFEDGAHRANKIHDLLQSDTVFLVKY